MLIQVDRSVTPFQPSLPRKTCYPQVTGIRGEPQKERSDAEDETDPVCNPGFASDRHSTAGSIQPVRESWESHRSSSPRREPTPGTGSSDRTLSRFAGGADSHSRNFSRPGGNCKLLARTKQRPVGEPVNAGGRQAVLGPKREGAHAVSFRSGQPRKEPELDFVAGGGLSQPAIGGDDSDPDSARPSQGERVAGIEFERHRGAAVAASHRDPT